jgi:antitoxin YefM
MESTTVNQFRERLREHVERVATDHEPLKVTRRNGRDFVVISLEDWEREQETLYVLQNRSLMAQIAQSQATHAQAAGYRPSPEELGTDDLGKAQLGQDELDQCQSD